MTAQDNSSLGNIRTTINNRVPVSVKNLSIGLSDQPGVLTFLNDLGTTILDLGGLVSTSNFPNAEVVNNSTNSTTSTTDVDISGSSLSPFTLTRSTNVLVFTEAVLWADNWPVDASQSSINCNDSIDGNIISYDSGGSFVLETIDQDGSKNITGWSGSIYGVWKVGMTIATFSAGTHTLKLQQKTVGTGTTNVGINVLGYIILGS